GYAREVHHVKHLADALVLGSPDELAATLSVLTDVQYARCGTVQPHLVLDRADADVVGRPIRVVLRYDEEAEAFRAWRRSVYPCQYEVNDILGDVIVTAADEDLGAADVIAPVRLLLGSRRCLADVAASPRFSQAHGSCP